MGGVGGCGGCLGWCDGRALNCCINGGWVNGKKDSTRSFREIENT